MAEGIYFPLGNRDAARSAALDWKPELAAALSAADRAVGQLHGAAKWLPSARQIAHLFAHKEAEFSSRIEGTQTTLGELLAVEAGASVARRSANLREVANHVMALEYGIARLAELPLSLRLVRELHARLMDGVRGGDAHPGEFRRVQNWIGPPGCGVEDATFVPPPRNELPQLLGEWESFLHDRTLPPLVQIALAHHQFEEIHPFLDGNGRVGRLLITLFLVERDILPTPLLYLSAFFEATRPEYYRRLQAVRDEGDWQGWLLYFLRGVAWQAEDAVRRAERINEFVTGWRTLAAGSASTAVPKLVDLLAENPYWTVKRAAERLDVAYTTAQRAIERLVEAGVMQQVGEAKRNRIFCATEILAVLEEPTRLDAEPR
ncbi:MAG: Fic family protein [bacterium]|nr:Fic family protein [bacterium]